MQLPIKVINLSSRSLQQSICRHHRANDSTCLLHDRVNYTGVNSQNCFNRSNNTFPINQFIYTDGIRMLQNSLRIVGYSSFYLRGLFTILVLVSVSLPPPFPLPFSCWILQDSPSLQDRSPNHTARHPSPLHSPGN